MPWNIGPGSIAVSGFTGVGGAASGCRWSAALPRLREFQELKASPSTSRVSRVESVPIHHTVLGLVIEKLAGMPWELYVPEHLLVPSGMPATSRCLDAPLVEHRARGYVADGMSLKNAPYRSSTLPYGERSDPLEARDGPWRVPRCSVARRDG